MRYPRKFMMQKVKSGAAPEAVPIAAKAVVEET